MHTVLIRSSFAEDIRAGFSSTPKRILSKYFYDEAGSRIFQKIMRMPEYYLTVCEYEILADYSREIFSEIDPGENHFDLIELGAGDGSKTSLLISAFLNEKASFSYIPVDISQDALQGLVANLGADFPDLPISAVTGDYFTVLKELNLCENCRKINLFLGSNIGNYTRQETEIFFRHMTSAMQKGDMIITGFDLIKEPGVILRAYDDPHGFTRDFNLNLLKRMNSELDADFDLSRFVHSSTYNPFEQSVKSYLVSNCEQEVCIAALNLRVHFNKWESIFTEISRKFTTVEIDELAEKTGFQTVRNFTDRREWYEIALWEKL